jgi:hypothetical protein
MKQKLILVLLLFIPGLAFGQSPQILPGMTNSALYPQSLGQLRFNNSIVSGSLNDRSGTDVRAVLDPGSAGGVYQDIQCTQSSTLGSCSGSTENLKGDLFPYGLHPYIDARSYGARAVAYSSAPAVPGCAASITRGTNSATLSGTNCRYFQNGDGVIIYGAGITNPVSTPSSPTVTPSGPAALSGINIDVASQLGSTTYHYCVASWNYGTATATNPGISISACSTVATITNGLSTLGPQSVTNTSITMSNNIGNFVTSGAQTLDVNMAFRVEGAVPVSFNGWWIVHTWTDSTHFTASQVIDTRENGPTTATTPGTTYWITSNQIRLSSAAKGSIDGTKYLVYRSGPGGGGVIACIMWPQLTLMVGDKTYLTCDDYGATYSPSPNLPWYVPTTAPSSATNEGLSTRITSGGGTASITLAANAINTVRAATILFDDAPAIEAALTASVASSAPSSVVIPNLATNPGNYNYVINSPLNMPALSTLKVGNFFYSNDTIIMGSNCKIMGLDNSQGSTLQFGVNPVMAMGGQRAWPYIYHLNTGWLENVQIPIPESNIGIIGKNGLLDLKKVQFAFSGNGYTSLQYVFLSNHTGGGSPAGSERWEDVVSTAPQLPTGSMTTPALFSDNGITLMGSRIYLSGKGLAFRPPQSGQGFNANLVYCQACYTPLLTFLTAPGESSGAPAQGRIDFSVNDTTFVPVIATFNQISAVIGIGNFPSSRNALGGGSGSTTNVSTGFFGNAVPDATSGVPGVETAPVPLYYLVDGNWGTSGVTRPIKTLNATVRMGPADTLFEDATTWPAPTCPVSPGGSVPIGTFPYQYAPVYDSGSEGRLSAGCTVTTSSGSRTVTLTWRHIPTAKGYDIYRNGVRLPCASPATTSPTWTDTALSACGNSAPQSPADGRVGMSNGMLHAEKLVGGTISTNPNCNVNSASPAECGSAASGTVVVPTTTTTYTVNTTAVTANSRIIILPITDNSGLSGSPTCNAPPSPFIAYESGRSAGTSFTFTLPSVAGASCWTYLIVN